MKKFTALTFAAAAAATAFVAPAAKAQTDPLLQSHYNLYNTIRQTGVGIFWNDHELCEDNWGGGMYVTANGRAAMLICQDNGHLVSDGSLAPLTPNDADSLRHEAQHVIQDCKDGVIADGELEPMLGREALNRFVKKGLTQDKIDWIIETYAREGADKETIINELEAFAVAANIDPDRIAKALNRFCF